MGYKPVQIVGTVAVAAGPGSIVAPGDTLLSGPMLDASIARPGIPAWGVGLAVAAGQVYSFGGLLYQVVQAHTTQSDWTPSVARSLFTPYKPPGVISPWVQPLGSFDAYPLGWKVIYNTFTYQSLVNANVWVPGAVGSDTLWLNLTPPPPTNNWAVGVAYKVADLVIYVPNGLKYKCLQAHTSIATWTPPATPSLWQLTT
jgi:hypothetical protein